MRYCNKCNSEVIETKTMPSYYCPKCKEKLLRIDTYSKKFRKDLKDFEEIKAGFNCPAK